MPKLHCPCGYIHNLSPIPDDGWITVPDNKYEQLIETENKRNLASLKGLPEDSVEVKEYDRLTRFVVETWGRLYECPQCRRLMWQKENDGAWEVFHPE